MMKSEGGGYHVFTGGDDNSVGVTLLGQISRDTDIASWTFLKRSIVRKAHAAGIAGVLLVRRGPELLGVSVSNDQRVKLWSIPSNEDENIKLLKGECIGVADAGDIAAIGGPESDTTTVVFAGIGLEAWSLE
jgi:hypothetical protein